MAAPAALTPGSATRIIRPAQAYGKARREELDDGLERDGCVAVSKAMRSSRRSWRASARRMKAEHDLLHLWILYARDEAGRGICVHDEGADRALGARRGGAQLPVTRPGSNVTQARTCASSTCRCSDYPKALRQFRSFLWHRNSQPSNSYKIIAYLTSSMDEKDGPFQYWPGSPSLLLRACTSNSVARAGAARRPRAASSSAPVRADRRCGAV